MNANTLRKRAILAHRALNALGNLHKVIDDLVDGYVTEDEALELISMQATLDDDVTNVFIRLATTAEALQGGVDRGF